jgi:hypothetical protein
VAFPLKECEPVESNRIPGVLVLPVPADKLVQVINVDPKPDARIPFVSLAEPAAIVVAVTVSKPELAWFIARPPVPVPPVKFPTTLAETVPVAVTQAVAPANTFAVNVTPSDNANDPPAVAPLVASFRTCPVDPRLVEIFTVMAKEFAMRTSPAANVTAAAVPLGVVAHTSAALMFPALRAK